MAWTVRFADEFEPEYEQLSEVVQDELAASLVRLEEFGPALGRPHVDTLEGSRYANMKELRFRADDAVWRVAFAFDPRRNAILLVAGDKSGVSEKRFYKVLIERADARYGRHLAKLKDK